ncbi:MAG: hypothetical protein AVDCRST_MAG68-1609, partial [uncultured Gemmatimonadetes bacterium]
ERDRTAEAASVAHTRVDRRIREGGDHPGQTHRDFGMDETGADDVRQVYRPPATGQSWAQL